MATYIHYEERIPLAGGHQARPEEINQVWKLISMNRRITLAGIATRMGISRTRAYQIVRYLKKLGHIGSHQKRGAWDVLVTYAEI